jgi:hypothetical protein
VFPAPPFRSQDVPVGVLVGIQNPSYDSTDGMPSTGGSLRTIWVPLDQAATIRKTNTMVVTPVIPRPIFRFPPDIPT